MLKLLRKAAPGAGLALALAGATAPAAAQAPGSPQIAGIQFSMKLRENFTIPAQQEPGLNPPSQTPAPVVPGFVVLKDDPNQPNDNYKAWSDIIYFDFQDPTRRRVFFISDPHGRPYSDADLSPYGISISQIVGNTQTVYLNEASPATQYVTPTQPGFGIATYYAYSDIDTLPPGTPLVSLGGHPFDLELQEQCPESNPEPVVVQNLPSPCQPGFLVLTEVDPTNEAVAQDNSKWSDVVYFRPSTTGAATQAVLISDSHAAGTPEHGITDSDLSTEGISVFDIVEGNTIYKKEVLPTAYTASDPATGVAANYRVFSDLERIVISVIDWTTIGTQVRFQFRVENTDPNCPTDPIHLVASSQLFGVFNPNFGPIGQTDVGPLAPAGQPNSFFDVFFDISTDMLPPSAEKTTPTMGAIRALLSARSPTTLSCPADNHWDGNVDIMWSGPGGDGHVNKHFGTLQVCPGHGNSYIHLITGCSATSTVSIAGVCPGFTVALVNNDLSPAPSPLPPGWDGKICVSANASVPVGTNCCFTVTVMCAGAVGVIDMCVTTCDCHVNPPGTPPAGVNFTLKLREGFSIPAHDPEPAQTYPLPTPVEPGYVVLKDLATIPDLETSNWSDIVAFQQNAAGAWTALMLSDPPGRHFTDSDLAQYGFSLSQIQTGHTVYLPEERVTRYLAADPVKGSATYFIYSDVDTLLPGTPLSDAGFTVTLAEQPDPQEVIVTVPLPAPVQPGFLVLLDDSTGSDEAALGDTTKWSDIVYFPVPNPGTAPRAILVSDRGNAAGTENGMSSVDLEPLGLRIFDVLEGNTVYRREFGPPTVYLPVDPATNVGAQYRIFSDRSETGVPRPASETEFGIRAAIPNPTTAFTRIEFVTVRGANTRLVIYNAAGQRVRTLVNGFMDPGSYSRSWDGRGDDGRSLRAGAYFAKLVSGERSSTRTLFLVK